MYRPIEKIKIKKLLLEIKRSKKGARLLIERERKRNKRKAIGHVRVTSQKVGRTRSSIFENSLAPPPPPPPHEKSLLLDCSPAALIYLLFLSPAQPFSESNPKRDGSVPTFSDVIYTHPKRPAAREREREKSIIKWGASRGGHIYIYFLGGRE